MLKNRFIYEEYLEEIFDFDKSFMKQLNLLGKVDNNYFPHEKIPCRMSSKFEKYNNQMYCILTDNCQLELRYHLPEKVRILKYENQKLKLSYELLLNFRQQVVLDYFIYNDEDVFILRGYGSKEYNSWAISVYFPSTNSLWMSPDYTQILKFYQDVLHRETNYRESIELEIKKVFDGMNPHQLQNCYIDNIDFEKNISFGIKSDLLLLYLIYYLSLAEDKGLF